MAETVNDPVVLPRRLVAKAQAQTPASAVEKDSAIARNTFTALNNTVQNLRAQGELAEAVRELTSFDGTVSTTVFDFVEVAHSSFTVTAYDPATQEYSEEGTLLANNVIARLDTLFDYSKGYSDKLSITELIEQSLLEVVTSGGLCHELVLNKARLPDRISIFPYDTIDWKSNGDGTRYPVQQGSGGEVDLNYATIFVSESHKHANRAYARTMMEPAVNTSWYFNEFIEEMRRTVRRQGHGRLVVSLNADRVKAAAPAEHQTDPKKLAVWMETVRSDVVTEVSALNPEDVIVTYDTATVDMKKGEGEKSDYVPLLQSLSGNLATALKASPSIIGLRMEGSQSLSNTESLIFLKVAKSIQKPVEVNLSRILTLAVRLYGSDSYVKFKFDPINLRPDDELEAFKTMRQDRILNLLSLGLITDQEAAVQLGTGTIPPGAPKLSGTFFKDSTKGIDATEASPNDDPQGRALQPDTPTNAGGESQ